MRREPAYVRHHRATSGRAIYGREYLQPGGGDTAHLHRPTGPPRAWTSIDVELVSVVLRNTLSKGERTLVGDRRAQLVLETRQAYQQAMRVDMVAGVEKLTGRKVLAFLSANHIEPDFAVESFVLEPRTQGGKAGEGS